MTAARPSFAYLAPKSDRSFAGKTGRKRLALMLAAIAVPAMAATGGSVGTLPGPAAQSTAALATRQAAEAALPFERPGMSFPGSAFFYMADPAGSALVALPTSNPLAKGAESGRELGTLIDVGAPARPFFAPRTGVTLLRAQECLAQAIWYEAASESEAGQRAVAQVVLNRVAHPSWPASVCGVVYQGSERSTGCQFTFTCDGSLARRPSGSSWSRAQHIAAEALNGNVYAPVGLATHYHTLWVNPYWAGTLDHIGTIGAHRFYRNRGAGGQAAAFSTAYAGLEPAVSGRIVAARAAAASDAITSSRPVIAYDLGPVPVAKQALRGGAGEPAPVPPPPPPPPSTPSAPFAGTGAVKAEYAQAGQWKAHPGAAPTVAEQ